MNRQSRFAQPFRLGEWTVLPERNRVSGPGGDVRLEPRVMAVLVRLAAEPGRVVGRQDLLDEVWGDAVVGEEILTRAVSELRRVFGDSARSPRYIETIINNGYRLIAPLEALPDEEEAPRQVATAPLATTPAPSALAEPHPPLLRRAAASVVVLAMAVATLLIVGRRDGCAPGGGTPAPGDRAVPLTAFPGHERQPAVTPDGQRVAFAWAGPDGEAEGVWVKQRNSETPLRLSEGPGLATWPAWAPDGQTVAWVQLQGGSSQIRTVPSIGGAARTLLTVAGAVAGLDWSPDGSQLVFAARDTATRLHRLRRIDPATLQVQDLNPGERMNAGEVQPRWSPDGTQLAWIRLGADGTSSLWVGDADARNRRQILAGRAGLAGLAWTAEGRRLVVGVDNAGTSSLWVVGVDGSGLRRLTEAAEFAWNPDVADRTGELVYEQVRVDQDLWRIRILGRDPWQLETSRFLASTRWEYEAEYSPDGTRLAFVSARSGTPELWLCDADGGDPQCLTDTGEAMVARPRWSPDGKQIAVNVRDWDRSRVALLPAAGGLPRNLTPTGEDESLVGWWSDGAGVLVERRRGRQVEQRLRDSATGALSEEGPGFGDYEAVHAGGYYLRAGGGVAHLPDGSLCGDDEQTVVRGIAPADRDNWRATTAGIFWVMRAGGQIFLMNHDPAAGLSSVVTDLPGFAGTGLAVAPDGSAVVYPRLGTAAGDLMRLANP